MVQTIKVVYENGVLRPKQPLSLKDGETIDILVMPRPKRRPAGSTAASEAPHQQDGDVPEYFDPDAVARLHSLPRPDPTEVARRLREIAALATKREGDVNDVAANHDRYLYGEESA